MSRTLERVPLMYDGVETSATRLLEVDPDLACFLTPRERDAARCLVVPVRTVHGDSVDVSTLVTEAHAFAAVVLEGMLVHHVRIAERTALRLLGSGDVFCVGGERSTMVLAESRCCATVTTRLALLDDSLLVAARHFPRLIQGLLARVAEQSQRDAAHLAISQLPRVDRRLTAVMWLLAEKWGRVTPTGIVVPLSFTHETLGGLVGASRPTVTLALSELAARGDLLKHEEGWLIREPPAGSDGWSAEPHEPALAVSAGNGSGYAAA